MDEFIFGIHEPKYCGDQFQLMQRIQSQNLTSFSHQPNNQTMMFFKKAFQLH
jgi:hypothetical protein